MKKFLPIFFILFSLTIRAQSLHIDSTRFITGINCCTIIHFTLPTADKGILLVGAESNNPRGIIPYFHLDTSAGGNVMVIKIDSNQKISWIKVYGGSQEEGANSAVQTADGGYAILATTSSDNGDVTGNHGNSDYWLMRLDDTGKLLWGKCYGGPGGEGASSIALTPDGGFILLGTTNAAGGDVPFHYGGAFDYDWWVVKTDSLGNKQWVQTLGGTGQEADAGTILSIDSAYYLISSSTSTDYNCTDSFWHPGVNTAYDYYILKLDTNGHVLWDSSYGGSNEENEYYAMYDIRDSSIVITGTSSSGDYMVTGNQGNGDMWVIKVNKNGTLLWQKTLGSPLEETGAGICVAHDSGYIAFGNTRNGSTGIESFWLFDLNTAGNEITNKIFGGPAVAGVVESPYFIIPYLNGYVACGLSSADSFTEGTTYGKFANYENAFISYIGYWPLAVSSIPQPAQSMLIYPNPAQNNTRILLANNTNNGLITIQNIVGQIIYTTNVKNSEPYIDITTEEWAKGFYLVKWESENRTILTGKLIIN